MIKITELQNLESVDKNDIIPLVDMSDGTTKKATIEKLINPIIGNCIKHYITFDVLPGKTLQECIIDGWDKFPKGVPFIASYNCLGLGFIAGYLYENDSYGSVIVLSYDQSFIIKNNNGIKTVKSL